MRKILGLVSELAGLCVAAEHLLGIYPALRLLLASGKEALEARADGFWCRRLGYGCDFVGDAGAEGRLIRDKQGMLKKGKPGKNPLEWIGRHSLLLYLLHQPVIYLLLQW